MKVIGGYRIDGLPCRGDFVVSDILVRENVPEEKALPKAFIWEEEEESLLLCCD